jgi:hypothetical protein
MTKEILDFIGANFGNITLLVLVIAVAIIAVKICINFDLNKYLERRKKTSLHKAQNYCLHLEFGLREDKNVGVISWFESPSGTLSWICNRCGTVVNHVDEKQNIKTAKYYLKNPNEYRKIMKKYNKYMKKAL